MKKFIDKETGKIVTVLNNDEAKKILEMYIEYCQGKREVKKGRLNLVNYLGDFVKYSNEKEMSKFYDTLLKLKQNFEFSRSEQKGYDSLLSFFEIYNKIDKGEFEVSKVTSFITDTMSKKQTIDEKILGNQELNFEEKINNIFFNGDFDLSILAKNACDKWDELLKQRINASNGEIEVSLKEEIAYQDLLALSNKEDIVISNKITEEKDEIEEKNEEITSNQVPQESIEVLNVDINENKSQENEKKQEENEENIQGPVIVSSINAENKKEEENETVKEEIKKAETEIKEEKAEEKIIIDEEDEIIGSSSIRDMTDGISLRDAASTFNEAIDDVRENNNQKENLNDNEIQESSTSYGTLRDM